MEHLAEAPAAMPGLGKPQWPRLRARLGRHGMAAAQLLLFVCMLAAWQLASNAFGLAFWVSSPAAVLRALLAWSADGTLAGDVGVTLLEAGCGFVLGALSGALVGFVFGWFRRLGDLFEPFILSFYTLPKIALAPLFVLWFGIGTVNKVMFAALLVFFMIFFTTFQGTRQVDADLIANARLMGASRFATWTKIAVPFSAVWVFTGLRIGLPYSLIGAIVGEFVAAQKGVGYRIKEATSMFDTATVFAGLAVLSVISFALLAVLKLIEKRALRWQVAGATITDPS
jgi:NitT/TauT family transport system permease protein